MDALHLLDHLRELGNRHRHVLLEGVAREADRPLALGEERRLTDELLRGLIGIELRQREA